MVRNEQVYIVLPLSDTEEARLSLCQNATTLGVDLRVWRNNGPRLGGGDIVGPTKRGMRLTTAQAKQLHTALSELLDDAADKEDALRLAGALGEVADNE
jgi:hypothetical protein